jgi:hypothetical protein
VVNARVGVGRIIVAILLQFPKANQVSVQPPGRLSGYRRAEHERGKDPNQ